MSKFPTGGIVRDPRKAADLVKFQNRQYSLDERRTRKMIHTCSITAPDYITGAFLVEFSFEFFQKERKSMSEQVLRNGNVATRSRTRTITQIAMLGAVAGILMNLEIPVPFLAPAFYQLDFSEVPVLVGSFAMGPVAGVLIELVKILVHFVTKGTVTAGVGDVANFLFGCTFAVPAGLIYRFHSVKSRKHAVAGMAAGTVLTSVLACFINAFILLPAYGKAFGMPVEAFIEMGNAVHSSVNNLLTFAAMIIFPFNLFKYSLTSVIVFLIYKKIRVILKGD